MAMIHEMEEIVPWSHTWSQLARLAVWQPQGHDLTCLCLFLLSAFSQEPVVVLLEVFSRVGCYCKGEYKVHLQVDSHFFSLPSSWPCFCLKGEQPFWLFLCSVVFLHLLDILYQHRAHACPMQPSPIEWEDKRSCFQNIFSRLKTKSLHHILLISIYSISTSFKL